MFLRNLFSSKEDRERRSNKAVIKKLHKKLERWDDMYSNTIVEYIIFLVRLHKNLNHGLPDHDINLKKFKEVDRELRSFYSSYDKIKYDHIDLHLFHSQPFFSLSEDVKTSLQLNENDANFSFLPRSFLIEASTMHVDESEFGAYILDEFDVKKKTVFKRDCRYNEILEGLKALYLKNKYGESEIIREVVRLSEEIDENIEVVQQWESIIKNVEKRHLNYCKERLTFNNRQEPAVIKSYTNKTFQ